MIITHTHYPINTYGIVCIELKVLLCWSVVICVHKFYTFIFHAMVDATGEMVREASGVLNGAIGLWESIIFTV